MTYNYKIEKVDLLEFQLYTASNSEVLAKKRRNNRLILMVASIVFAGYFLTHDEKVLGIYFCAMLVLAFLFYYRYFSWKQKLNYGRFIEANYANRFGMEEILETYPDKIHVKDNFGEGDVKASELEKAVEIGSHFFLNLTSGTTLIIPKAQINIEEMKNDLSRLKIPLEENLNWSWKSSM